MGLLPLPKFANFYFAHGSDCKVLWWVSASVRLSVCLSVCLSPEPHTQSSPNFCACCLCPWLCPPPACLWLATSPVARKGFSSPLTMHYNELAAKEIIWSPIMSCSTRDHSIAATFAENGIGLQGGDGSAQCSQSVIYNCLVESVLPVHTSSCSDLVAACLTRVYEIPELDATTDFCLSRQPYTALDTGCTSFPPWLGWLHHVTVIVSVHCDMRVSVWCVLAGQVEDGRGSGRSDSLSACWGTAKADHCDTQGHAGPTRGASLISETSCLVHWCFSETQGGPENQANGCCGSLYSGL